MSMSEKAAELLNIGLTELEIAIRRSPDPLDAIARAKRALIADAADTATDAAVDAALKARG